MEILSLLQQSYTQVINGGNILGWIAVIIIIGMYVGREYNQGSMGLKRSMVTITPVFVVLVFATLDSVYAVHQVSPIGPSAFNSVVRNFILSLGYTFGLWYGHMIASKATEQVYREHGIKHDPNNLANL
jgi:hypothetical protein